jgi:3-hydroxyisobutyrate dehydrogenase
MSMADQAPEIAPGSAIGFVGLGRMGHPMAARLAGAGYRVLGYDASERAALDWARDAPTGTAAASLSEVAAPAVVLMLPDSGVVTDVLVRGGLLAALPTGAVVVDMSSSDPQVTQELAGQAADRGVALVDAPVSGGVRGAQQGTLTVMVGGGEADVARVSGLLGFLGQRVMHVGGAGAGHAVKALNNLMSATHLLATSEAMIAAARFGLDIPTVLDAVNTSSGRSGSTDNKWPNFIDTGTFDSGFGLRLMLKDMQIALGLAQAGAVPASLSAAAVELWARAARDLPADADHTEIARWLQADPQAGPEKGG